MSKGRRQLSDSQKWHLACQTGFACAYCQVSFGSVVRGRGRESEVTRLEVDHLVPVAWTGGPDDSEANLVASCQVCNRLKSSKMFDSVVNARRHLDRLWVSYGYVVEFIPTRSNFEDPEGWAREYARHMRVTGVRGDAE